MKRLFTVNGEHFATKEQAKAARGNVVEPAKKADPNVFGSKATPAVYQYTVQYGPDHWKRGGEVPGSTPVVQPEVKAKRSRKKVAA